MDKILLRPSEAAELLGFSRSKVYELLATGVLPRVRVGLSFRIPSEALHRWVESQIEPAPEPSPPAASKQGTGGA